MPLYDRFSPDVDSDPGRAAELAKVAAYPQAPARKLRADENDIFNGVSLHFSSLPFLTCPRCNWRAWSKARGQE